MYIPTPVEESSDGSNGSVKASKIAANPSLRSIRNPLIGIYSVISKSVITSFAPIYTAPDWTPTMRPDCYNMSFLVVIPHSLLYAVPSPLHDPPPDRRDHGQWVLPMSSILTVPNLCLSIHKTWWRTEFNSVAIPTLISPRNRRPGFCSSEVLSW